MQTGFGDAGDRMAEQYMETMTNILVPVLEQAVVLAAEYSKACGRDTLLPEDMEYTMKYCAMHTVGQTTGSCLLYTSPSPRDATLSRMPSSA